MGDDCEDVRFLSDANAGREMRSRLPDWEGQPAGQWNTEDFPIGGVQHMFLWAVVHLNDR